MAAAVVSMDDNGHGRREAELLRHFRQERSDHFRGGDDLGEFVLFDLAVPDESVMVDDAGGITVICHPGSEDGIRCGDNASGQPEIHGVGDIQELGGVSVNIGHGMFDQEHVCGGVFPGKGGRTAGQPDPAPEAERAIACHTQGFSGDFPKIFRTPGIHPEDAGMEHLALSIDRDRTFALSAAADRRNRFRRCSGAVENSPCGFEESIPPVLRFLFRAAVAEEACFDGLKMPRSDFAAEGDEGSLAA